MPSLFQVGTDPAGGRAGLEHVGHRREINQVNAAFIPPYIPGMGVPEDISFDLFSRPNDLKQGGGVFQAKVSTEAGVVMNQHQRRFVAVGVERSRQPVQLLLSQQTGRGEGCFERVEHEPIRPRGAQQRNLPVRQAAVWRPFPPATPPRSARGYRDCPRPGAPAFGHAGLVLASPPPGDSRPFARFISAVASDEDPRGALGQRQQFARDGREVVRHVDAACDATAVRRQMDVGQQCPGVRISAFGGSQEAGTERERRCPRHGAKEKLAPRDRYADESASPLPTRAGAVAQAKTPVLGSPAFDLPQSSRLS